MTEFGNPSSRPASNPEIDRRDRDLAALANLVRLQKDEIRRLKGLLEVGEEAKEPVGGSTPRVSRTTIRTWLGLRG